MAGRRLQHEVAVSGKRCFFSGELSSARMCRGGPCGSGATTRFVSLSVNWKGGDAPPRSGQVRYSQPPPSVSPLSSVRRQDVWPVAVNGPPKLDGDLTDPVIWCISDMAAQDRARPCAAPVLLRHCCLSAAQALLMLSHWSTAFDAKYQKKCPFPATRTHALRGPEKAPADRKAT